MRKLLEVRGVFASRHLLTIGAAFCVIFVLHSLILNKIKLQSKIITSLLNGIRGGMCLHR